MDPRTIPAGPVLDRLIAEKVMGWDLRTCKRNVGEESYYEELQYLDFLPSTNIAHAWEVLVALRAKGSPVWGRFAEWMGNGPDECDPLTELVNQAGDAPLIICRGALEAVA